MFSAAQNERIFCSKSGKETVEGMGPNAHMATPKQGADGASNALLTVVPTPPESPL